MKKILFLIVLSAVFAFAGCKKVIVHKPEVPPKPSSDEGLGGLLGGSGGEDAEDSIYFRRGSDYQVFVVSEYGSIHHYKSVRKGYDTYECGIPKFGLNAGSCRTYDEDGVIVDRESYEYDRRAKSNPLEVKLRELYKKAKAGCKE
ncbi:MAG: hypothetical protein MJZ28_13100 [Paludibacteraceae bacterium]|nr:hypothetical protein [Paludibacteraceae bacterium]